MEKQAEDRMQSKASLNSRPITLTCVQEGTEWTLEWSLADVTTHHDCTKQGRVAEQDHKGVVKGSDIICILKGHGLAEDDGYEIIAIKDCSSNGSISETTEVSSPPADDEKDKESTADQRLLILHTSNLPSLLLSTFLLSSLPPHLTPSPSTSLSLPPPPSY